MKWLLLAKLLGSIGGIFGSVANVRNAKRTNAANIQMANQANAMQVAESEKAYERSKAGNQVGLMMQAGMSRAGAINALNGGGSYTPASINTAQAQAPQVDTSVFQSIVSNAQQAETVDKQIQAQIDMQEREIDFQREKWAAENARAQYDHNLAKLDREKRDAAAAITAMANPADYDTPAEYRKALYLKASPDQRKYFSDSVFSNAIDLYHAANANAKSVAATTEGTQATTAHTKADTERLKTAVKILKNDLYISDQTILSQAERVNAENALRTLIAESGYKLEDLKYDYLTSEEGKDRQQKIERAKKFWELMESKYGIPARVLAKVARLVGAVYVGKGLGTSSAAGQVVRQGGYEFIYSD